MLFGARVCLLAAILVADQFAVGVSAAEANLEPVVHEPFKQVKSPGSGSLVCDFRTPLVDCKIRFSLHNDARTLDTLMEFANGARSTRVELEGGALAAYAGAGLDKGECGVKMAVPAQFLALVECFGQTADKQWGRGFGLITAVSSGVLPSTAATPRLIAAKPGADVSVHLKTRGILSQCNVGTPGAGTQGLTGERTLPTDSRYRRYGAGPKHGECGFTLYSVQKRDAGVWWWSGFQGNLAAWQAAVVAVQAAPSSKPELSVDRLSEVRVGGRLNATCRAPASVPPSNITWLLGGKVIRQDALNLTDASDVGKTRLWQPQPLVQSLSREVKAEDMGKKLECSVTHPAMTGNKSSTVLIPAGLNVTAASDVVRTAVGHQTELVCIVEKETDVTVQWLRNKVPVIESSMVKMGSKDKRHWLRLDDTTPKDLTNFTCNVTKGTVSVSRDIKVTGYPGTPVWVTTSLPLSWRVESKSKITEIKLRVRKGTGKWEPVDSKFDVKEPKDGVQVITVTSLPGRDGPHSITFQAKNERAWSEPSESKKVILTLKATKSTKKGRGKKSE